MLRPNDRTLFENQILSGMLNYEEFFLKVYEFNPDSSGLFRNSNNRIIYETILEYYVETGYPVSTDIYSVLILKNVPEEIKQHFRNNIAPIDPIADIVAVYKMLEDSIEFKLKWTISQLEQKNLVGLDYAYALREEADKAVIDGFERYKKDERSNEQKVVDLLNSIQDIKKGGKKDYIPTGFTKLDDAIIGIPKAHLTTIASRPGMGKTTLLLGLKRNLVNSGHKPLIISIEMTSDQLLIKDLSAISRIDSRKIESGEINDDENKKITEASNMLKEDNYFIEDDGCWTIEKIKSTIRRHIIKHEIDIVFIDYLTLVRISSNNNRYDLAIGEITNSLREFAKETGLPIVILSQLNRDCERRIDKRPILADLRESGSIEQDSKTVLFLFRPDYYGIEESKNSGSWKTKDGTPIHNEELAEVIIAKARSGKTGIVPLRYMKEIHVFENIYKEMDSVNSYSHARSIKSYYESEERENI